jgi:hypothetical protein
MNEPVTAHVHEPPCRDCIAAWLASAEAHDMLTIALDDRKARFYGPPPDEGDDVAAVLQLIRLVVR